MTLPPRRLIGLHWRSRQVGRAALGLIVVALALRAGHHWTSGDGLFPQVLLLLLDAAAATIIATSAGSPFGEAENTASRPLPLLRLTHLVTLTGIALAAVGPTALTTTYAISGPAVLRDLAGLTGIALLSAALLGAHLAWAAPLGYVVYCGGELDLHISNLRSWPTLPAGNHPATFLAAALLTAGLAAVSLAGTRDHRTVRS
jgi:hypothetical protein